MVGRKDGKVRCRGRGRDKERQREGGGTDGRTDRRAGGRVGVKTGGWEDGRAGKGEYRETAKCYHVQPLLIVDRLLLCLHINTTDCCEELFELTKAFNWETNKIMEVMEIMHC